MRLSSSPVTKVIMMGSTTVYPSRAEKMVEDAANLAIAQNNNQFSDKAHIMLQAKTHCSIWPPFHHFALEWFDGTTASSGTDCFTLKTSEPSCSCQYLHQQDAVSAAVSAVTHADDQILNVTTRTPSIRQRFIKAL